MSDVITNAQKAFDVPLKKFGADNFVGAYLNNVGNVPNLENDQLYVAGYMLDTPLSQAEMGFSEEVNPLYQIDAVQLEGKGTASINAMIDKLRAVFHAGAHFNWGDDCFTIDNASASGLIVANGYAKKSLTLSISGLTKQL